MNINIKSDNEKNLLVYKTFIQQELIKNGILWSGYHAISWMHKKKDIEKTISGFNNALKKFEKIISSKEKIVDYLEGKKCKQIFQITEN